jgi:hypothetical protein
VYDVYLHSLVQNLCESIRYFFRTEMLIMLFAMIMCCLYSFSISLDMGSWEELAMQFLLEEEEDDEEFFILLPAILPFLSNEKRSIHTSSLSGAQKVKEILEGHESWCKSEFRMEPEIFRATLDLLRREGLLRDT